MATAITAPANLPSSSTFAAGAALAGRFLVALIFLLSGANKIAAADAMTGYIASIGLPFANVGLVLAIAVEIGGGLALLIGFRARFAATLLALFCVATAALFHAHFADQNQFIHFFKNLAMAGGLLQVAAFGAGRFSFDARRR